MKSLLALLLVSGSALADDISFLRCREIADGAKRLACYDAVVVAPGVAGTPAPSGQNRRETQEKSFGLVVKNENRIESIQSHIPGPFEGWTGNEKIKLANGQVWQVIDDSTGVVYGKDLKAAVARGAMGAMYMEIEGTRKSPKVRRVQ